MAAVLLPQHMLLPGIAPLGALGFIKEEKLPQVCLFGDWFRVKWSTLSLSDIVVLTTLLLHHRQRSTCCRLPRV